MKVLEDIKELIEEELKDIKKKGCLTPQELASVHDAIETIMYIDTLCKENEMNEYEKEYSGRRYTPRIPMNPHNYSSGYSGHDDYMMNTMDNMNNMYSGCGRRNYSNRYDSYNNYDRSYSREGANANLLERLEAMLDAAPTDRERNAIRSCINNLSW